jgi:hypothetical protein
MPGENMEGVMDTLWERLLRLPVIKSKVTAEHFIQVCSNEDWSHVFSMDPADQTRGSAWKYRKEINNLRKLELKAVNY